MGRVLYLVLLVLMFLPETTFANEKWRRVLGLDGSWKFSIGDNKKWAEPSYNDSDWERISVPAKWEDEGFNGYNGYAWYRRTFNGAALTPTKSGYYLFLGYIDDVDEVYLNGHLIGQSGSFPPRYHTAYNAERKYIIPNDILNLKGVNVVAVRVYDAEIEGGIVSGNVGIYVNDNDEALAVNLRGIWDFTIAQRKTPSMQADPVAFRAKRTPPENATWSKVTVPSLWEHQGFDKFDGTAWYRRQFFIPKELEGEELVLILGKIDDYDQAYLNGQLVGTTTKYDHLRVYPLSPDKFKAGAYNLLMVFVSDFGGGGGIYEGPVGLMKQTQFTRFMRYRN